MKWYLAAICLVSALRAQDPYARSRELQDTSAARQREAVGGQSATAVRPSGSFFALPWPAIAPPAANADCEPLSADDGSKLVATAAQASGVAAALLKAVIRQESGFKPCAVSAKGAQGLMQLMPATVEQYAVRDPFSPAENIMAGAKHLKGLLSRYQGDVKLALSAYNAGPGVVDKVKEIPDIPETRAYVAAIMREAESPGLPGSPAKP